MADYIDAGKLNKAAQVLELRETAPGVWEWTPVRRAWASITFQSKTNLFSKVGIGARDAAVIVRRQPLTLHHALRWGDTHLFLTSIVPMGRNHLEVDAAVVRVETVRQMAERDAVVQTFPGVLTEFQSTHPARGATANFTKEQRVCLAQFAYLHKGKKAEHTKTNAPMLH